MVDSVIVNLPFFPGFYESSLSGTLDNAEEQHASNEAEREESREYYPETYQPEELRLDSSDYAEILMGAMDYGAAHRAMAAAYVDSFDNWASEALNTAPGSFVFESMDSPREYNFTTDRVYVTVSLATMESLYNAIDPAVLREAIEARHTSRSGFISFYSNDLDEWQGKAFDEFDHNEYGTILAAAIHASGQSEEMRDAVEYPLYESDYEFVDQNCNWAKFETLAREKRAEKLAEWIQSDMPAARAYVDTAAEVAEIVELALVELDSADLEAWGLRPEFSHYRCPFTIDMFQPGVVQ